MPFNLIIAHNSINYKQNKYRGEKYSIKWKKKCSLENTISLLFLYLRLDFKRQNRKEVIT